MSVSLEGHPLRSKKSLILDWIVAMSLPICASMSFTVHSLWAASCSLAVGKDHATADLSSAFFVEYF